MENKIIVVTNSYLNISREVKTVCWWKGNIYSNVPATKETIKEFLRDTEHEAGLFIITDSGELTKNTMLLGGDETTRIEKILTAIN